MFDVCIFNLKILPLILNCDYYQFRNSVFNFKIYIILDFDSDNEMSKFDPEKKSKFGLTLHNLQKS